MTARLPVPGKDNGTWGTILNTFLDVSHNGNGTLKTSALQQAGGITSINSKSPTGGSINLTAGNVGALPSNTKLSGLSDTGAASTASDGQVLAYQSSGSQWVASTISSSTVGDATTSSKGIVELTSDLGGTATSPTVVGTHLASALPLNQGGTGQITQQAALDTLAGGNTSGSYLRGNGTHVQLSAIQTADVPTLNQNTTGTAANITDTLDQIPSPAANVSLNNHKITNLSNGTASTDAAAFGQIPAALPPNGSAGGDLSGSYPNPTVAKVNGVSVGGTAGSGLALIATSSSAASWSTLPGGVQLDTTAGDIQPLGAQAAGSIGKAADAGHVHAMPNAAQVSALPASADLSAIATANATAGNVAMNSNKITGLANGTASTDAAAFGQIPAALPPNGSAGGDLSGSYPNPTVTTTHLSAGLPLNQGGTGQITQQAALDTLAGGNTSGSYLRGNGTHVQLSAIQTADVPTLNQNTTGTAANITDTLDQIPSPAANVSLNNHKITNLSNGTASTDAAAFGQIPTVDSTVTDFQFTGVQSAGSTGKIADAGHVHPDKFGAYGDMGSLVGWTCPFSVAASNTGALTVGVLFMCRILIPSAGTTNNMNMWVVTAGTSPANVYVALINSSGTIVAQSANRSGDTALVNTSSLWTAPWTASYTASAGYYYGAVLFGTGTTTAPQFKACTPAAAAIVNLGTSAAAGNLRAASTGSSLSSLPGSITMSGISSNAGSMFMALS